jgi:glycosyltransferase involved in cell wall biosynthesis
MAPPLISVVIDSYNYGRYIEEAVESVLAQDFPPDRIEILAVDDGSTDDTAERLRKYAPKVRYLHKPNGGQASAFNFGLQEARGGIVAFLDADDYWLPGKLPRVAEEFERHPEVGMVYHNFCTLHADGEFREGGFYGQSGFLPADQRSLLRFELHPTSALAFRRSTLDRILPVPEELVIQADAYLSACAIFVAPVSYLPAKLAVYRIHGGNLWNVVAGEENTARVERRLKTTRAVGARVREWLQRNSFDPDSSRLRPFFQLWKLPSEGDEFRLSPPGRLRFVRHLLEYPRYYGARMTWRHRVVSYANAFGALFTGYHHYHLLDRWRVRTRQALFGRRKILDSEKHERRNVVGSVR